MNPWTHHEGPLSIQAGMIQYVRNRGKTTRQRESSFAVSFIELRHYLSPCAWASTLQVLLTLHSRTLSSELLVFQTFSLRLEVKHLTSLILKPLDLVQNHDISYPKESSWPFRGLLSHMRKFPW